MNSFSTFLQTVPSIVWVIASGIAVLAFGFYHLWFMDPLTRLVRGLRELREALPKSSEDPRELQSSVAQVLSSRHELADPWNATLARIFRPAGQKRFIMLGSCEDLWTPSRLLGSQMNLALAEAVPNILVGVGLLFTFFFLSISLGQAADALTASSGASDRMRDATHDLLQSAGAKFITSLTGLLASLLWLHGAKRGMERLRRAADDVVRHIEGLVRTTGVERVVHQQTEYLAALSEQGEGATRSREKIIESVDGHGNRLVSALEASNAHQSKHVEHLLQTINILEELLTEAREQSGTFKRFETDIAVSLAGALKPELEAMTGRMVAAVESLSEKLGSMNQDALQDMIRDFSELITKATAGQMTNFNTSLNELAEKIAGLGPTLVEGGEAAAGTIDAAAARLVEQVSLISTNLVEGANQLQTSVATINAAMQTLATTVSEASRLSEAGSTFIREAIDDARTATGDLKEASSSLAGLGADLRTVGTSVSGTIANIEKLALEQHNVVVAVKEATPNALAAIEKVSGVLKEAAGNTAEAMKSTEASMKASAAALEKTVASITGGIETYSEKVADLHGKMDQHLAAAIGSLDTVVTELQESVEELSETLTNNIPRG